MNAQYEEFSNLPSVVTDGLKAIIKATKREVWASHNIDRVNLNKISSDLWNYCEWWLVTTVLSSRCSFHSPRKFQPRTSVYKFWWVGLFEFKKRVNSRPHIGLWMLHISKSHIYTVVSGLRCQTKAGRQVCQCCRIGSVVVGGEGG